MKTQEKLQILAESAQYDASCASSGSARNQPKGKVGNIVASGICHSWSADGRCISLLKVLLSNDCKYNCSYCFCRKSNDIERVSFTPEELADLTIKFYVRNYIEGLFLSSAVDKSPNDTMQSMIEVCRLLREKKKFNGYIHLKVIPGVSQEFVQKAGFLADRLSVNIELPSERSLKLLAPQKSKKAILAPMTYIGEQYTGYLQERTTIRSNPRFCPAGHSTQLIIGASPENDLDILNLTQNLYHKVNLKRVYFSAYIGVNEGLALPGSVSSPPLLREHRLYQADWLMRFYKFKAEEILTEEKPILAENVDPKAAWAMRNFSLFPLDIARASYDELLRVPGIGPVSAKRIVQTRKVAAIREEDLKKIGLVAKRARYFLTINGKYLAGKNCSHAEIYRAMEKAEPPVSKKLLLSSRQLRLF